MDALAHQERLMPITLQKNSFAGSSSSLASNSPLKWGGTFSLLFAFALLSAGFSEQGIQLPLGDNPLGGVTPTGLSQGTGETNLPMWRPEANPKDIQIRGPQPVAPEILRPGDPSKPWEKFALVGQTTSQVVLVRPIPKARVLDELKVSVPVRANQPGATLRLRVTLPRSLDQNTGRPLQFFLLGSTYARAGRWDNLQMDEIPRRINRHLFVLRAEHGPQVDPREAYVDQVGVILYVGRDPTEIEIGSPVIQGLVPVAEEWLAPRSGPSPGKGECSHIYGGDSPMVQLQEALRRTNPTGHGGGQPSDGGTAEGNPPGLPKNWSATNSRLIPPDFQGPISLAGQAGGETAGPEDPSKPSTKLAVPPAGNALLGDRHDFDSAGSLPSPGFAGISQREQDPEESGIQPAQFLTTFEQSVTPPATGGQIPRGPNSSLQTVISADNPGLPGPQYPDRPFQSNPPRASGHTIPGSSLANREAVPPGAAGSEGGPRLVGSTLMDGFRPIFPRLITWQGEPLLFIRQLGMNGIWIAEEAPPGVLGEAWKLGLWAVAAPPQRSSMDSQPPSADGDTLWPPGWVGWNRLLAWNLGHQRGRADLPHLQQLTELLRSSSARSDAPTVCHVLEGTRELSRMCDVLVFERPMWEESLSLMVWWEWLRRRAELARPGTPFWCGIPVQLAPWITAQLHLAGLPLYPVPSWQALRVATFLGIGAGARGIVFTTAERLDATDNLSQWRQTNLQLLQTELEMIEPFLSGGTLAGQVPSSDGRYLGILLRTERARLLIPVDLCSAGQGTEQRTGNPQPPSFTVPGIPEAYRAYLLIPGSLRPLRHRRTAGGILLQLDECPLGGHILLTNEPMVVTAMNQRAAQAGPTAAGLLRRLVRQEWELLPQSQRAPAQLASFSREGGLTTGEISRMLGESDDQFRLGNYAASWQAAEKAIRRLQDQSRQPSLSFPPGERSVLVSHPSRWVSGPPQTSETTTVATKTFITGPNLLPGGDLEDLSLLLQEGWRHYQTPGEPAVAEVFQSSEAAFRGRGGLVLRVTAAPDQPPATLLEAPPVWFVTPTLPPPSAEWIRIGLRVKIPQEIQATVEGLVVADSYGGLPMGIRLRKTEGWKRVELYRRVPPGRPLEVLVALAGYGTAYIDEMSIEPLPAAP